MFFDAGASDDRGRRDEAWFARMDSSSSVRWYTRETKSRCVKWYGSP